MDSSYHLEPASDYTDSAQDVSAMDQYLQEQPSDDEEEPMTTEEQGEEGEAEVEKEVVREEEVEEEVEETKEEKLMRMKQYEDVVSLVFSSVGVLREWIGRSDVERVIGEVQLRMWLLQLRRSWMKVA